MGEAIGALVGDSTAILLGRTTYEMFAPAWSARTAEDDPGAPFFNDTRKYVVSSTLTDPGWGPATVLDYSPKAIRALKDETEGTIYVSGSATLVRALLADGLVDELHLFIYPVAFGSGTRLFPTDGPATKLRLVGCEPYDSGVVHLTYAPAPSPSSIVPTNG
jgi:dihydrofolate reductase